MDATLLAVLELLTADVPLPSRYVDHPMKGPYGDCRDCHLRPDLVGASASIRVDPGSLPCAGSGGVRPAVSAVRPVPVQKAGRDSGPSPNTDAANPAAAYLAIRSG